MTGTFGGDPEFDAQIEEEYLKASAEGFKRSPGMPLRRSDESRPKPFRWPGLGASSDTVSLPREDLDQIAADFAPRQQPASRQRSEQREPPAQRQPPPAPEPPAPPTPPVPPAPPTPPVRSASTAPLAPRQSTPAPPSLSPFAAPTASETATIHAPERTPRPTDRDEPENNEPPTDETRVVSRQARSVAAPEWVLDMEGGPLLAMSTTDVIVGRRPGTIPGCSRLTIEDPGRTLSKSHVRLTLRGEVWFIEDLGSTNGSALITAEGSEQVLVPGEPVQVPGEFRLGTLLLRIRPLVSS